MDMYTTRQNGDSNHHEFTSRNMRNVYLDGAMGSYGNFTHGAKVAPSSQFPNQYTNKHHDVRQAFAENDRFHSKMFQCLKPIFVTMRFVGLLPISHTNDVFHVKIGWIIYSILVVGLVTGYVGYSKWNNIKIIDNSEGKFEEVVIDYLFTVYLIPIIITPLTLYEAKKQANVLTDILAFEKIHYKISKKELTFNVGKKPLIVTIVLPILAVLVMVITHLTMANFAVLQVIPYCYVNVITYMLGGAWFIYCDLIGEVSIHIADDFQNALKNIGPLSRVSNYRSLWMMLSRIIRNVGNSFGYALTFLCLYLFFVITLTIYGLFSQIQDGMGLKDIGLTLTAVSAITMLYFICDEAHYASACVRTYFQKKLLLVELSWMNDDVQQEINMFLRATEMNPTDICLCGFFDVNRNLFKSLLATMVTYLVVLLQFQISIPEEPIDVKSLLNLTRSSNTSVNTH